MEGPGFEALGLTNNKTKKEARVPDRAPLVLPPDRARLPDPAQVPATTAAAQPNWPNDPDKLLKDREAAEEAKQSEYEDKGDWSGKGGVDEFEKLMDPLERKKGLLSQDREVSDESRDDKEYR